MIADSVRNRFIKYQTLDKNISNFIFDHFKGEFSAIKLSVSIFEQTAVYRIYIFSRESIRLPEIQYPVFGI